MGQKIYKPRLICNGARTVYDFSTPLRLGLRRYHDFLKGKKNHQRPHQRPHLHVIHFYNLFALCELFRHLADCRNFTLNINQLRFPIPVHSAFLSGKTAITHKSKVGKLFLFNFFFSLKIGLLHQLGSLLRPWCPQKALIRTFCFLFSKSNSKPMYFFSLIYI